MRGTSHVRHHTNDAYVCWRNFFIQIYGEGSTLVTFGAACGVTKRMQIRSWKPEFGEFGGPGEGRER